MCITRPINLNTIWWHAHISRYVFRERSFGSRSIIKACCAPFLIKLLQMSPCIANKLVLFLKQKSSYSTFVTLYSTRISQWSGNRVTKTWLEQWNCIFGEAEDLRELESVTKQFHISIHIAHMWIFVWELSGFCLDQNINHFFSQSEWNSTYFTAFIHESFNGTLDQKVCYSVGIKFKWFNSKFFIDNFQHYMSVSKHNKALCDSALFTFLSFCFLCVFVPSWIGCNVNPAC